MNKSNNLFAVFFLFLISFGMTTPLFAKKNQPKNNKTVTINAIPLIPDSTISYKGIEKGKTYFVDVPFTVCAGTPTSLDTFGRKAEVIKLTKEETIKVTGLKRIEGLKKGKYAVIAYLELSDGRPAYEFVTNPFYFLMRSYDKETGSFQAKKRQLIHYSFSLFNKNFWIIGGTLLAISLLFLFLFGLLNNKFSEWAKKPPTSKKVAYIPFIITAVLGGIIGVTAPFCDIELKGFLAGLPAMAIPEGGNILKFYWFMQPAFLLIAMFSIGWSIYKTNLVMGILRGLYLIIGCVFVFWFSMQASFLIVAGLIIILIMRFMGTAALSSQKVQVTETTYDADGHGSHTTTRTEYR